MQWPIKCGKCGKQTKVRNIVELVRSHRDGDGWLICPCGEKGSIKRLFKQQEGGAWKPYLRGIIPLANPARIYQPFVFLVSYKPKGPATDVWFSYYKDLRKKKGLLKLGYGPGGPPVLNKRDVLYLLHELVEVGYLSKTQINKALG